MKSVKVVLSALLVLTIVLSGCSALNQAKELVEAAQSGDSEAIQGAIADATGIDPSKVVDSTVKYNSYIDAVSSLNGRVHDATERYLKYITDQEEYKINKKKFDASLISVDYIRGDITKALENADKEPVMAIDAQFKDMGTKALALIDALDEADKYYGSKGYVDDDFKKGEEIHTKFVAAKKAFDEIWLVYSPAHDQFTYDQTLKEIEKFKNEGYFILYNANIYLLDAKEMINQLETSEVKKNAVTVDAEKFLPLYDKFTKSYEELSKYTGDQEQIKKEGIDMLFSSFKTGVDEVKAAASVIKQKLNDKEKISVDDINDLMEEYSDLIDDYNNIIR